MEVLETDTFTRFQQESIINSPASGSGASWRGGNQKTFLLEEGGSKNFKESASQQVDTTAGEVEKPGALTTLLRTLYLCTKFKLKVHFNNINGLNSNKEDVHYHLETARPDLFFLQEIKLSSQDITLFNYPGYDLEHKVVGDYYGLCVYVQKHIDYKRLCIFESPEFPDLWILVETGVDKIIYVCVYRPPSYKKDQNEILFKYLSDKMKTAQIHYPSARFVFLGDFNAKHKEWSQETDNAGRELVNFCSSSNLTQLVKEPTRVPYVKNHTPNCLDLIMTPEPDKHSVKVKAPLGNSDHSLVMAVCFLTLCASQICLIVMILLVVILLVFDAVFDKGPKKQTYHGGTNDCFDDTNHTPFKNSAECAAALALKEKLYRDWADACARKNPDEYSKRKIFREYAIKCRDIIKENYIPWLVSNVRKRKSSIEPTRLDSKSSKILLSSLRPVHVGTI